MKKKLLLTILTIILVTVCCSSLVGCKPLSPQDAYAHLMKAYENSIKENIFYWTEDKYDLVTLESRRLNIICDIDRDYQKVVDANGKYVGENVYFSHRKEKVGKAAYVELELENWVGLSKANKKDAGKNLMFTSNKTATSKEDLTTERSYIPYTTDDFREANKNLKLDAMLSHFADLKEEDMVFSSKEPPIINSRLVTMSFTVTDAYKAAFKETHGEASIFDGIRVNVELAYNRIASVIVLEEEILDSPLKSEYEKYKLKIVYFGPKIGIPKYNEVDKDKNLVWKAL